MVIPNINSVSPVSSVVKSPQMNAARHPLNTQNKPIFKPGKIAVSDCLLRAKNNELRTGAAKNKPKQTHFLSTVIPSVSRGIYLNSHRRRRYLMLESLGSCILVFLFLIASETII